MPKKSKKLEKNILAIIAHVLGLLTGFIGPLIIYLVAEDDYAKKHSKIVLNWQFSIMIYAVAAILMIITIIGALIGIPALIALGVMNTIFSIIGIVKASENKLWGYPLSIPFFEI